MVGRAVEDLRNHCCKLQLQKLYYVKIINLLNNHPTSHLLQVEHSNIIAIMYVHVYQYRLFLILIQFTLHFLLVLKIEKNETYVEIKVHLY